MKKAIGFVLLFLSVVCFLFGDDTRISPRLLDFCTRYKENSPSLSADGMTLYFHSDSPDGRGGEDIWYATRKSITDDWGAPINIGTKINTVAHEWAPFMTKDGLSLYFASDRHGGYGGYDIWVSKRPTVNAEWGDPANVGDKVNSRADEANPCLSSDGLCLLFSDYVSGHLREKGYGGADLWQARRPTTDSEWEEPTNLGEGINSPLPDVYPRFANDDLLLLFSSSRLGGSGGRDIWYSTRATKTSDWQPAKNAGPVINTRYLENAMIVSDSTREIFFVSDRIGGRGDFDLYLLPITELPKMVGRR